LSIRSEIAYNINDLIHYRSWYWQPTKGEIAKLWGAFLVALWLLGLLWKQELEKLGVGGLFVFGRSPYTRFFLGRYYGFGRMRKVFGRQLHIVPCGHGFTKKVTKP